METILTRHSSLPRKFWGRMQGWYSVAVDHAPPPARITLKRITAERKELYCAVPPPPPSGENIAIYVPPSQIDNSLPIEEEVEWAVQRLRGHRSGGLSRMRDKHLWEWMQEHRSAEAVVETET